MDRDSIAQLFKFIASQTPNLGDSLARVGKDVKWNMEAVKHYYWDLRTFGWRKESDINLERVPDTSGNGLTEVDSCVVSMQAVVYEAVEYAWKILELGVRINDKIESRERLFKAVYWLKWMESVRIKDDVERLLVPLKHTQEIVDRSEGIIKDLLALFDDLGLLRSNAHTAKRRLETGSVAFLMNVTVEKLLL